MLIKIVVGLVVVIGGLLIYAAVKPPEWEVSREVVIKAPPEAVFPHINHSKMCQDWMPWAAEDPQIQISYSGPEQGVGSTASWTSPGKMGVGQATVITSDLNKEVRQKLTYQKPMEMEQLSIMSLTPTAEGTKLRWSASGNNKFFWRFITIFMNVDKMIGSSFEKGLNTLKTKVEAGK
jgi:hypothetical protein